MASYLSTDVMTIDGKDSLGGELLAMPNARDSLAPARRSARFTHSIPFIKWRFMPADYREKLRAQAISPRQTAGDDAHRHLAPRVPLRADGSASAPRRAHRKPTASTPSSAISKQPLPHSKAWARTPISETRFRLAGTPLKRSTSDNGVVLRLTNSLAIDAALAASKTEIVSPLGASETQIVKLSALPFTRSAASVDASPYWHHETRQSASASETKLSALPLKRSAASELAITIASEMRLSV